jgi:hypothetical protein
VNSNGVFPKFKKFKNYNGMNKKTQGKTWYGSGWPAPKLPCQLRTLYTILKSKFLTKLCQLGTVAPSKKKNLGCV